MAETSLAEVVKLLDRSSNSWVGDSDTGAMARCGTHSRESLQDELDRAMRMLGELTERLDGLQRSQRLLADEQRRARQ